MRFDRHASVALAVALAWAPAASAAARPFAHSTPAASQAAAAAAAPDYSVQLAAIEAAVEAKRKEFGIPGLSLVVVKDDKVIYMKGMGLRNVEKNLPVTPDTLFGIGSSTKAFTAMAAVISADEGKLSLDDSPRKHLPYFSIADPETDAKVTLRDLLSHRTGLNRTDLAWISGKLDREEIIRVAGKAKPVAKLGEKFMYQNVMFTAAGEATARANGATWDQVIETKIFRPLGMKSTVTTVEAMRKSSDYSLGYEYNFATKTTRMLPTREFAHSAPAGAIDSSARDMAQWLRLMIGGGVVDGKRLVSEKGYAELVKNQMKVGGTMSYGLGWFLRDWKGHKVVEHGGNIDGFNASVGFMPDARVGYALLTNVTASAIGEATMNAVWTNLAGDSSAVAAAAGGPAGDPNLEVGTYNFAEAGMAVDVAMVNGKLVLTVPGQPPYTLENVGGRRYKLAGAPDGYFATFRPSPSDPADSEFYLEQPQGNYTLARVKAAAAAAAAAVAAAPANASSLEELIGRYEVANGKAYVEIERRDGKVSLVAPNQPPYPLTEKSKDLLLPGGLPEGYSVSVKRSADGKVSAIVLNQPQGNFEAVRVAAFVPPMSVDDMMAKMIAASGGEANLRKHKSMVAHVAVDFVHQGVTGEGTISQQAPSSNAVELDLWALGKKISWVRDAFDGTTGVSTTSFTEPEPLTGTELDDARVANAFYGLLDWKTLFKTVEIKRAAKVENEDAYVVVMTPEKGTPVTVYVSAASFLVLRKDTINTSSTSQQTTPASEFFGDYRTVDGVMVPFLSRSSTNEMGDIVTRIKDVKFDAKIPAGTFATKTK